MYVTYHSIFNNKISKVLIILCGCTSWSKCLLFAYGTRPVLCHLLLFYCSSTCKLFLNLVMNVHVLKLLQFLAHLSRRLIGELIVYQWSVVRPQCSKIFFSETAGPIKAKFNVEPPWVGGTIFCSRHLGHMTKMAATPIYGKNPSKIFFSRTGGPIFTKLGMQHRGLQPIIVCSNDDPGVTLTYFTARSNLET